MPGEAGAGAAGPDPSGGLSSHNGANAANGRGARRRGAAGATAVPGPHYKWIALSNTTLGVLMATINQSIVLIALPDIFRGIGLNPLSPENTSYLLWMFMGFLVVSAVLVVSFGSARTTRPHSPGSVGWSPRRTRCRTTTASS